MIRNETTTLKVKMKWMLVITGNRIVFNNAGEKNIPYSPL